MYKLIAIDMDGTLLNDQHEVPKDVRDALHEAKKIGVSIVLCSGRPLIGMHPYVKKLQLDDEDDYLIAYNGAVTQNTQTHEIIVERTLEYDDLRTLYDLSKELGTFIHFFDTENIYTPHANISPYTVLDAFLNQIPLHYMEIDHVPTDLRLTKVMFIDQPENLSRVVSAIPAHIKEHYMIVQSAPHFLEFTRADVSKGNAVRELAEERGISQAEVMAIGDNGNDLSMIQYAGCGVAMDNAIPEIKEAADLITHSNNDSGVAYAIQKLVINNSSIDE